MEEKMPPAQVHAFLAWVNQHEPRVEPSPANVEVWHKAIYGFDPDLLKDVLLEHWSRSDEKPTPAGVRRLAQSEIERRASRQRALERPARTPRKGRGWSVMDEPWFQAARENARVAHCERHGIPHDGDGWTAADRPTNPKPPGFLNNE